jgi:oxygen-dependent protoporphyrinogen oxidase
MAAMDEAELWPQVIEDLKPLLGIEGEPVYRRLARWPRSMPQYHVGHKDLVARIQSRAAGLPRFALIGNAFHGVGIPDCIHTAETAVDRLLASPL